MNRATAILFWFSMTIVVSVALYDTSYRVQDLRGQLRAINAKIEAEQRNLHVLKAEWGYLTNPARIEMAARKHLKLAPTATTQIARLDDLSDILAMRNGDSAGTRSGTGAQGATQLAQADHDVSKVSIVTKAKIAQPQASAVKVALDDAHVNTHIVIQRTTRVQRTANADDVAGRIIVPSGGFGTTQRGATP